MNEIKTVFFFTLKSTLRKKAFRISTVIILAVIPRARVCTADPEAVYAVLAEEFEIVAQSFDRGECQRFEVPIKRIIPYGHALGNSAPFLEFLGVGVIRRAVGIRSVLGALFTV